MADIGQPGNFSDSTPAAPGGTANKVAVQTRPASAADRLQ